MMTRNGRKEEEAAEDEDLDLTDVTCDEQRSNENTNIDVVNDSFGVVENQ